MEKSTKSLIHELSTIFSSQENYQRKIAEKGFWINKNEQRILEKLKSSNNYSSDEISAISFRFGIKYFGKNINELLNDIKESVISKLDSPADKKHQIEYFKLINQELNSVYINALKVKESYSDDLSSVVGFIENTSSINTIAKSLKPLQSSNPEDMIDEMTDLGKEMMQIDEAELKDIIKIPFSELYLITADYSAELIKSLGRTLLFTHQHLLTDNYTIPKNSFPLLKLKKKEKVTDSKIDFSNLKLIDIWEYSCDEKENKAHFKSILSKLSAFNMDIDSALVSIENGSYVWCYIPNQNTKSIQGFLKVCMKESWINKNLTPSQLRTVFNNTFKLYKGNDIRTYRNIMINEVDEIYTKYLLD